MNRLKEKSENIISGFVLHSSIIRRLSTVCILKQYWPRFKKRGRRRARSTIKGICINLHKEIQLGQHQERSTTGTHHKRHISNANVDYKHKIELQFKWGNTRDAWEGLILLQSKHKPKQIVLCVVFLNKPTEMINCIIFLSFWQTWLYCGIEPGLREYVHI